MQIFLNDMLGAMSYALDNIERELVGVTLSHGKRVGYLCACLAKDEFSDREIVNLYACGILHDNALTEYIAAEAKNGNDVTNTKRISLASHCKSREENIKCLPFYNEIKDVILYHHELEDGKGPFGKISSETPYFSQLVHMADYLDATYNLDNVSEERFEFIRNKVIEGRGILFGDRCVDNFINSISYDNIKAITDNLDKAIETVLPRVSYNYSFEEIEGIADMFARIVDYKSSFTSTHSVGVASLSKRMAEYYGYPADKCVRMYVAGAFHDIGKMVVDNDILEKPDKLTSDEFDKMKHHSLATYNMLRRIEGFEDITRWASRHHEKLNGRGYPFQLDADELDMDDRLMGCIDIYQALTEDRPYKKGMTHEETMKIMYSMVEGGFIDGQIVKDIDKCMQNA